MVGTHLVRSLAPFRREVPKEDAHSDIVPQGKINKRLIVYNCSVANTTLPIFCGGNVFSAYGIVNMDVVD